MEEIFVPLEIAKKLKEIGFNEPCIAYYFDNHPTLQAHIEREDSLGVIIGQYVSGRLTFNPYARHSISVPTYEQVLKWFRGKELYCYILSTEEKEYWGEIDGKIKSWNGDFFSTYEGARDATILKMIEMCAEQRKNKLNKNE